MAISLIGLGTGVFFLLRKKNNEDENLNVQAVGEVGEVVSDQIPEEKIVSQEVVGEAIITKLVDGAVFIEKEDANPILIQKPIIKPVVISEPIPIRLPESTYYPRIETDIIKTTELQYPLRIQL